MRILLDECIPQDFRHQFRGQENVDVQTARFAELHQCSDAELLDAIAGRFDLLITTDANLRYQQNLTGRPFAVIENVVTLARHRRKGLGRALLQAAQDRAWAASSYKIMIATGRTDEGVLRFYEEAGFSKGGKTFFEARRLG